MKLNWNFQAGLNQTKKPSVGGGGGGGGEGTDIFWNNTLTRLQLNFFLTFSQQGFIWPYILQNLHSTVKKFIVRYSPAQLPIIHLALVIQKMDNTINWINHYSVDSIVQFVHTYPL